MKWETILQEISKEFQVILKDTLFARAVRYSVLRVHPQKKETVGVDDGEVPPVPIPNTEVKLTRAEDSWLETACENR